MDGGEASARSSEQKRYLQFWEKKMKKLDYRRNKRSLSVHMEPVVVTETQPRGGSRQLQRNSTSSLPRRFLSSTTNSAGSSETEKIKKSPFRKVLSLFAGKQTEKASLSSSASSIACAELSGTGLETVSAVGSDLVPHDSASAEDDRPSFASSSMDLLYVTIEPPQEFRDDIKKDSHPFSNRLRENGKVLSSSTSDLKADVANQHLEEMRPRSKSNNFQVRYPSNSIKRPVRGRHTRLRAANNATNVTRRRTRSTLQLRPLAAPRLALTGSADDSFRDKTNEFLTTMQTTSGKEETTNPCEVAPFLQSAGIKQSEPASLSSSRTNVEAEDYVVQHAVPTPPLRDTPLAEAVKRVDSSSLRFSPRQKAIRRRQVRTLRSAPKSEATYRSPGGARKLASSRTKSPWFRAVKLKLEGRKPAKQPGDRRFFGSVVSWWHT